MVFRNCKMRVGIVCGVNALSHSEVISLFSPIFYGVSWLQRVCNVVAGLQRGKRWFVKYESWKNFLEIDL